MPCCGSSGCNCKIISGPGVGVSGAGSVSDPYVVSGDLNLTAVDSDVFDLGLDGDGSPEDPYELSVAFADTARLADIPDVNADDPSEGQVLAYDHSAHKWKPAAPSTAPVGAVDTDTSIEGDGSSGDPLGVIADGTRGLTKGELGVGIRDSYLNQLVRQFDSPGDRSAASPGVIVGTLSQLASRPGQIDRWDGSSWVPVLTPTVVVGNTTQLQLSGDYDDSKAVTHFFKLVVGTVDASGQITLISTSDLAGYDGVIMTNTQETNSVGVLFHCKPFGDTNRVTGVCFDFATGDPLPNGTTVRIWVDAWLYG